jgi:phosphotriesterase-related protein
MDHVMTVTGPIRSDEIGFTLMHEHIFLDITRDIPGRNSLLNDTELAFEELMRYKNAGGVTIVDQTTANLNGHDHDMLPIKHPLAVRSMSERTGLNVILGTGWYRELYYDQRLNKMKTDQIAEELVHDITIGIQGTDVRAGILGEIGTQFTWISGVEERVFRAVARAHKKTGVMIATHALNGPVGIDQLDILEDEGVDLRRVVVGHCHSYPHHDYHAEIAKRGAFVEFDRLGTTEIFEQRRWMELIKAMIDAGLIKHLLFSQDVCNRTDYLIYGGKGYAYIPTKLQKDLEVLGVTKEQFNQITIENPKRALFGYD